MRAWKFLTVFCLACLLSAWVLSCDKGDNEEDNQGSAYYDPADDDEEEDDKGNSSGEFDCENSDNPYCIFVEKDFARKWICELDIPTDEKETASCSCINDYMNLIQIASDLGHTNPISEEELFAKAMNIENDEIEVITDLSAMHEEELSSKIKNILNNNFLTHNINDSYLIVTTISQVEKDEYFEEKLLFQDPFVGEFMALLLKPKSGNAHPGIVALHGHCDSVETYRDIYHGKDYPSHGYTILMLSQRAMCNDINENIISKEFLLNGLTFYGIRNYEALLCRRYLEYLLIQSGVPEESILDRIGVIGHSSGSAHSNLFRGGEFKAQVSDESSTFGTFSSYGHEVFFKDDFIPDLYQYSCLIRNLPRLKTNYKEVPYGYEDPDTGESLMPEIFQFFEEHLKGE